MLRVQRVSAERGFSVSEKLWKAYSKPLKNTHEKSKVCSMTVTTGYLLAAVSCDTQNFVGIYYKSVTAYLQYEDQILNIPPSTLTCPQSLWLEARL